MHENWNKANISQIGMEAGEMGLLLNYKKGKDNGLIVFISRMFLLSFGLISSYLLLRLVWRACFEGNGVILVNFNGAGEIYFELIASILMFVGFGVFGIISLFGK